MKSKKLLVSLSLCTCLALNTYANEENKSDLGEVEVTDTALEAQIKSITSQKLDNLQASDIKDILRSMPSVVVDGNSRYSQKVYIRGLEDKSSNITIDGAKISGQLFHHSGDQTIDAEMLKIGSIELGPNSALSGSGVINGSFIYETKDPSDYLEGNETFGGKISTGYQSAYGRKSLDLAIFSKINEQFEFVGIGNITEDNKLEIPETDDIKSKQSKLKSGLAKVIFKANDENTFKFSYNKYSDGGDRQLSAEKPGSTSEDDLYYNEILRDTYTLNYNYNPGSDLVNFTANAYHSSQELYIEALSDTTYWTYGDNADEPARNIINETQGIDLRNVSILNNHQLTYGFSYDEENQKVEADGSRTYTSGTNIGLSESVEVDGGGSKNTALYFEDEISLNKLLLTLGARYDSYELTGIYSGKSQQLSPKLKAEYNLTDELKLRAGYGRIFKGPSLGEAFYVAYDGYTQDTNTQAQTGDNYEIGFDYDLSNALNADESIFGFTVYTYDVDNYIHPSKNESITNQADVNIWGVESIFRYKKDELALSLSHTYTGGSATSLITGIEYDPRTTKIHTFKLDVDYQYSPSLYLNYNAEYVPSNKRDYLYENATGSYTEEKEVERLTYAVHNVSATYKLSSLDGAKLSFGIDNIFNRKYARHTSFGTESAYEAGIDYETGRNYKIKLSYKF